MESSEYSRGKQAADFHLVDGAKSSPHAHGQESQRQVFKCPEASKDRHEGKKIKIISVGLKPPRKGTVGILIHFSNPEVGAQPRDSPSGSAPTFGRSSREGNGDPLQCSCLENPRDGGAWWAAIYGVTQSRT